MGSLQNQAPALAGFFGLVGLQQGRAGGSLEDLAHTLVGAGRALEVLVGTDLLADFLTLDYTRLAMPMVFARTGGRTYLLRGDRLLRGLGELLNSLGVVAQILLATNKDNGETLAEVKNLGNPLQRTASVMNVRSETLP